MSNKTNSYDTVLYDEPQSASKSSKIIQMEKKQLENAQISLNMVAVMFLWSHNNSQMPIFLLCVTLFCYFNHISIQNNTTQQQNNTTTVMCNVFSGCIASFMDWEHKQVMKSGWDLRPKSRWEKYVSVQCWRFPLCALITLSPIPRLTHIRPSIARRLIELKRWPLHNSIYHSSWRCDLGIAYAEVPVGMVTTLGLKG